MSAVFNWLEVVYGYIGKRYEKVHQTLIFYFFKKINSMLHHTISHFRKPWIAYFKTYLKFSPNMTKVPIPHLLNILLFSQIFMLIIINHGGGIRWCLMWNSFETFQVLFIFLVNLKSCTFGAWYEMYIAYCIFIFRRGRRYKFLCLSKNRRCKYEKLI